MAGGLRLAGLGLGQGNQGGRQSGVQPGSGTGSTGGQGQGQGGLVGEDPNAKSSFVPERSRSAVTAGRILMELKDGGVANTGRARIEHNTAIRQVQQGVSEAILKENVPPSYHEAIKSYFDELDAKKKKK